MSATVMWWRAVSKRGLPLVAMFGVVCSMPSFARADEPPSTPESPTPPRAPVPPAASGSGSVPVTIDAGPKNAVVERKVSTEEMYGRAVFIVPIHTENEKWESVCVAPCQVTLDRASRYRVTDSNGVTDTNEFTLPPGASQVDLRIDPGNLWMHRASRALISLGTAAAIVGGALITTASKFDDEVEPRRGGIITGGIGVLLLGVGIPMAILSKTHVTAGDKKLATTPPRAIQPRLTPAGLVF
jgi:hypothetical protein